MNVRKAMKHAGFLLASVGVLGLTACEDKPTETPFPAVNPEVAITGIQISGGVTRVFASASDEDGQVTRFVFSVDGGAPDTLTAPVLNANVVYGSMDEEHTVTVFAIDNEGRDSEVASLTFTPNSVGAANKTPDTEILAPVAGATTSAGVVVEWAARDPDGSITGYQVSFDGGDWVDVSADERSYAKAGLSTGSHYVQVRAKDNFNVWDPTPATAPFTVISGL